MLLSAERGGEKKVWPKRPTSTKWPSTRNDETGWFSSIGSIEGSAYWSGPLKSRYFAISYYLAGKCSSCNCATILKKQYRAQVLESSLLPCAYHLWLTLSASDGHLEARWPSHFIIDGPRPWELLHSCTTATQAAHRPQTASKLARNCLNSNGPLVEKLKAI